jgi:hypothetical protein
MSVEVNTVNSASGGSSLATSKSTGNPWQSTGNISATSGQGLKVTNWVKNNSSGADGTIVVHDRVTVYGTSSQWAATRFYNGSQWVAVTEIIDGNLLVTGSINAADITSSTTMTGVILQGGTVQIGTGSVPGGWAFRVGTGGVVESDNLFTNSVTCYAPSSRGFSAVLGNHAGGNVGVEGRISFANSNSSAHGIRGHNSNSVTSGLVGPANAYSFYAESGSGYGPFTGSHDAIIPLSYTAVLGDIMVDVACVSRSDVSNTIFEVESSSTANQQSVIGVCSAFRTSKLEDGYEPTAFVQSRTPEGAVDTFTSEWNTYKDTHKLVTINALGEGQVNVTGEGGNMVSGDLISSSSTLGKGMKQSDNIVRSITVAKIRETVTFSSPSEEKMVACIYLCG